MVAYHLFNAAVFIILEAAAIAMLTHSGELQNEWLAGSFHSLNAKVWGGTEKVHRYFNLQEENDSLAAENFRLSQKLRAYEELEEKKTAEAYLSANQGTIGHFRYIPAIIAKHSNNKQHNYFILDKGSNEGVAAGDGVVTEKATVGIVEAVSPKYSLVMAFTNSECVISARLGKEGPIGPLIWDGLSNQGALLKEIPCHMEVTPGDTIYTSGYSSIFPPDIPLGTAGETKIINGATYEIKTQLFEDLAKVRFVTIVVNKDREEITSLEER